DADVRQSEGTGGGVALPAPALDGAAQAHPAAHAGAAGRGDARASHGPSRERGAGGLPEPPAARGVPGAPPGARALPSERRAAPGHGGGSGGVGGARGDMSRRLPGVVALVVPLLAAGPVLANPVAVPAPVLRALRAASVVVLPAQCGGVLTTSPELV